MSAAASPDLPPVVDRTPPSIMVLGARDRRTIALGAAVVAIALSMSYVVVPFATRWRERGDLLTVQEERLARVRALVRDEPTLAQAVRAREAALALRPRRPLGARSGALAASALQSLVQEYAVRSRVQLSRIDVATAPNDSARTSGLPVIPATIAAAGDVYGLAELVTLIERGPRLLEITDLAVQSTRGPAGETLLQIAITLRAPYAPLETP